MSAPATPISPAVRGLLLGVALTLAAFAPAAAAPFRIVITEETTPLLPDSVIELALTHGYFQREGVEVALVRVQQTPLAIAAMVAGHAEMANVSVDTTIKLAAQGNLDYRAVTSPNTRFPYLVAARGEVRAVADLRGRVFGIGRLGSLDHTLAAEVLRTRGLALDSKDMVSLGPPDARLRALAAGRIAATAISASTWAVLPRRDGLHVLVSEQDFAAAAPIVGKVNVVSGTVLKTRRREVEGVVAALIAASRHFAATPAAWVEAMAKARPDVGRAALESIAVRLQGSWSVNGGLSRADLAFTAEFLYRGPDFRDLRRIALTDWVDFSVVDAVLARMGTMAESDPPER